VLKSRTIFVQDLNIILHIHRLLVLSWKQLQSATRSDVIVPRCRTKFGSRAFSVAGPEVWNRLPQSVRSADTVRQFRRLLKTQLTTSTCISVLTNSAVTVFNPVFILHTFYYYCNASRSGFVYRGH